MNKQSLILRNKQSLILRNKQSLILRNKQSLILRNKDLANFSTDLLRVSYWIYHQNDSLAMEALDFCRKNYSGIKTRLGCYKNVWDEIKKIEEVEANRMHAAERALTLSRILIMYS